MYSMKMDGNFKICLKVIYKCVLDYSKVNLNVKI